MLYCRGVGVWCCTGCSSMGTRCGLRLGQNASPILNNNNGIVLTYCYSISSTLDLLFSKKFAVLNPENFVSDVECLDQLMPRQWGEVAPPCSKSAGVGARSPWSRSSCSPSWHVFTTAAILARWWRPLPWRPLFWRRSRPPRRGRPPSPRETPRTALIFGLLVPMLTLSNSLPNLSSR